MMYNKKGKDTSLEEVLKRLKAEEKESIHRAESYLPFIDRAIQEAKSELNKIITKCEQLHFADSSITDQMQKQLNLIGDVFEQAYSEARFYLQAKKNEKATFNITLFGKTMAGKSTLMAILTKGNGNAIGKGGQRTTRDIRRYEWKGLTITDVPGINAFDGKEDENLAMQAARTADLIIFIINDGSPESIEADWLCKLKHEDKPMLCLINCKQAIADEFDRDFFLEDPDSEVFNSQRLKQVTDQFNEFIHKNLPNEHVTFYPVHLQAEYMSLQTTTDKQLSQQLHNTSRFGVFESAITRNVALNGSFLRRKAYLVQIDSPLYKLYEKMLDSSQESYTQFRLVSDRMKTFEHWKETFNEKEIENLHSQIDNIFNAVRNQIPGFVEDYLEESDFGERWDKYVKGRDINGQIDNSLKVTARKVQEKVESVFEDLGKDMLYSASLRDSMSWRPSSITNYKRIWGWGGAITGAASVVGGLLGIVSGPVGWAIFGASILFGIFSWLSDSREDKLRRERQRAKKKLNESIDKQCKKAHRYVHKVFYEQIVKGMEEETDRRLRLIRTSMMSLTNSQRSLALKYLDAHIRVTTDMIRGALQHINANADFIKSISLVARIPSKYILIVLSKKWQGERPFDFYQLCKTIGSQEQIAFVDISNDTPLWRIAKMVFRRMNVEITFSIKSIDDREVGEQNIAYIEDKKYTDKESIAMELVEQVTKIQFINN